MANANVQTRATLGDLGKKGLGPAFEDVFYQDLASYDGMKIAERVFSFVNTSKATLRTTGLTGYALGELFDEGEPIPETQNIKTYETQYNIDDYGKAVTVTDNALKDREVMAKKREEVSMLAKSAELTVAKGAFQILNGAFATSATKNGFKLYRYNDEALCSASHARADGGTAQSNLSATGITLTELNLETGRLALVKQLTDIGTPIMDMGMINLVVPDDLEKNAVIYTGSQLRATTANNDLNFYRGRMNVICSRWLNSELGGSSTAWFLIARTPNMPSPLRVYRNGGPEFNESERESRTWNRVFAYKNRFALGNSEWKGVWGSAGA